MKTLWLWLLAACGPQYGLPEEHVAQTVVWYGVYGQQAEPPRVVWLHGAALTCAEGRGFPIKTEISGAIVDVCAAGAFYRETWTAVVAIDDVKPGHKPISATAYTHELWHAVLSLKNLTDYDHVDPGFQPGGKVDEATYELMLEEL